MEYHSESERQYSGYYGYRMPTEEFIAIWAKANEDKVPFSEFLRRLKEEFDWCNKGYELTPLKVRTKCYNLNLRLRRDHNIDLPIPPASGEKLLEALIKKHSLCEYRKKR